MTPNGKSVASEISTADMMTLKPQNRKFLTLLRQSSAAKPGFEEAEKRPMLCLRNPAFVHEPWQPPRTVPCAYLATPRQEE
jgi:hypothetical protein